MRVGESFEVIGVGMFAVSEMHCLILANAARQKISTLVLDVGTASNQVLVGLPETQLTKEVVRG